MNSRYNKQIPEDIFNSSNYRSYVAKYQGDIENGLNEIEGVYVIPIDENYLIILIRKDLQTSIIDYSILEKLKKNNRETSTTPYIYINYPTLFKLQDTSPIEASEVRSIQNNTQLNLTGKGVVVGIIDTGIDYLSDEFMTSDGKTRINFIWDQTITNINSLDKSIPYGTIYSKEDIDGAINLFRQGGEPYSIVPSKDYIGHGTNMASIVGARGKNVDLKGVAPECEFYIVKLAEDVAYKEEFNIKIPIFDLSKIVIALDKLYKYALETSKPMVIYLPLGTNSGNHRGDGILDEFTQRISDNAGIVIVTGSGNEGARGCHASGNISNVNETETMELYISDEQRNISVEIWIDTPNIMALNIISPSGEETGSIPIIINSKENFNFIFENTAVEVKYFLPEDITGDELILIYFNKLKVGLWKLRLTANSITDGAFNAWIPVEGISVGDTRFITSDPYGTITVPGDSPTVITAASYDQNNNNIVNYSGRAFRYNLIDVIAIAAGGVNAEVVAPNNKINVVNGTSVSAAVTSGVCALLFQWGIVDGNYPYMYSQSILTYIVRGTIKRQGDIYPNSEWGYGILNALGIFENMI